MDIGLRPPIMSVVIYLMGPTATGKTDIAVELLKQLPIEIISVDSALVYRDMDIGTAKPSREILQQAPHRLIDICDPSESYSAAQFRKDALREIAEIEQNGNIPLLVGGTGLYFRSLEWGISKLPKANSSIRKRLEKEILDIGLHALHQRLAGIDPDSARRIDANDPQRIQRALEVYELTGKSLTEHFQEQQTRPLNRKIIKIILMPGDRDCHRQLVKERFLAMLEQGLVEEVESLYRREDLSPSLPSMRMVGYRQIWNYLEGKVDYEEMRKHAIVATRQLAKRQMTWFRKEDNGHFIDSQESGIFSRVLKTIENNPLVRQNM